MAKVLVNHPLTRGSLYVYRLGDRFDPGAQAEAFLPLTTLPALVFRGIGRVAGALNVFQHPQVRFNYQTGIQGVGGLQAGQYILQPLVDNTNPVD